jgi:DNA-binding HxlR family transcriptional regulator
MGTVANSVSTKGTSIDPLRYWIKGSPLASTAEFTSCPIAASLGVLGRKWTMLILRDMAMRKAERFSDLTRSIPGITPRALSMRLKELEQSGMIERVDDRKSPRLVRWNLTEKGWDTLPILLSYVAFGSKWFAPTVFNDGKPREMNDIYPQKNLKPLYVNIDVDPARVRKILRDETSSANVTWNK